MKRVEDWEVVNLQRTVAPSTVDPYATSSIIVCGKVEGKDAYEELYTRISEFYERR